MIKPVSKRDAIVAILATLLGPKVAAALAVVTSTLCN